MTTQPTQPVIQYVIWDRETCSPYLDVRWNTYREADRELRDLLKPYRKGHRWRFRLKVMPWDGVKRTKPGVRRTAPESLRVEVASVTKDA